MNATEAYSRVYPSCTRETARRNGHVLLTNTDISEAIDQRLAANAMSANEVLSRLTEHAAGDMGDFWNIPDDGDPVLNLVDVRETGKLRLIKKLKIKKTERVFIEDEEPVTTRMTEVDFELYDAQAALEKLGKHHKLFSEKIELDARIEHKDVTDVSDEELVHIATGGSNRATKAAQGTQ